jgi:hypothetical protein
MIINVEQAPNPLRQDKLHRHMYVDRPSTTTLSVAQFLFRRFECSAARFVSLTNKDNVMRGLDLRCPKAHAVCDFLGFPQNAMASTRRIKRHSMEWNTTTMHRHACIAHNYSR